MIQKLLTLVKGLPWWAWVLVGLTVLYLFNVASGSIYSRKLWNMIPLVLPSNQECPAIHREKGQCIPHSHRQ